MLKKLALTSAIAMVLAAPGYAQTTTPAPVVPSVGAPAIVTPSASTIDSKELIGRNIQNAQNETVGEIESVAMGPDGRIRSVIVGVGGFLGMGERLVAIDWNQLQVTDNGRKVVLNTTKDQLKAMPEYKYAEGYRRGSVLAWTDTPNRTVTATAPRAADDTRLASPAPVRTDGMRTDTARTVTDDPSAVNAKELIGRNIHNAQNDTVGEIESVILNSDGKVRSVVVGVGGFLGMGEKLVAVDWNQLQVTDNGRKVVMNTTKDQLKGLPDYRYPADQRRGGIFTPNEQRSPTSAGGSDTTPRSTTPGTGATR